MGLPLNVSKQHQVLLICANPVRGNPPVVALGRLEQCVDAERHTVGKQDHLLLVGHGREGQPQLIGFAGKPIRPLLVPLLDRLAPHRLAQVRGGIAKPCLGHADLHAASLHMRPEHRQAQRVQQGKERGIGRIGERVAQRQRTLGGQFGHEPVGQRTDGVVFVVGLFASLHLATDAYRRAGRSNSGSLTFVAVSTFRGRFIFGTNISAVDPQPPIVRQRHEHACACLVLGIISDRTLGERGDTGVDLGQRRIDLVGQVSAILN